MNEWESSEIIMNIGGREKAQVGTQVNLSRRYPFMIKLVR